MASRLGKGSGRAVLEVLFVMLFTAFLTSVSFAAKTDSRLDMLEEALKKQQKQIEEQQKLIEQLRKEVANRQQAPATVNAGEKTEPHPADAGKGSGEALKIQGAVSDFFKNLKNPALTFVLNSFYYGSSLNERSLKSRGITGFSSTGLDQRKGFNIDEFSVAAFAPVDDYFDLFGVVSFKEEGSSIEEAYFNTRALPANLRLKGGKFKSQFSVHNEMHPHEWDFTDTALVYKGFMGKDGIMEKGAQLTWRPALPLKPFFGIELLQGENATIFQQDSTGGPHAFTAFAKFTQPLGQHSSIYFGPYVINGRTATDSVADGTFFQGNSTLSGFETIYEWKPSENRGLTVQGEYMWRKQQGDLQDVAAGTTDRLLRSQDGIYIQSLYQIGKWRVGARYDRLNLLTDTYRLAGVQQNFDNPCPWRLTGALEFNPSEFARFRFQYSHDRSGGGSPAYGGGTRTNNEFYLQMILAIGAHLEPKGQRD